MNRLHKLIYQIVFSLALLLPFLYLFALTKGFYFSGDTIYFLQFSTAAEKFKFWNVFLIHLSPWPPLAAIFYNLIQILPGGFITEQKAYLMLFLLLNFLACYLLVKKYGNNLSNRIIITSLILFSSTQVLLLRISLADIQFMAWWILAVYFLDKFIQTREEKYVGLYLIPASLIPLTRYAGIPVTLILSTLLIVFSIINYKTKKYSFGFIILAAIFTLIPISLYLFRNFLLTHSLFGYYDPQFEGVNQFNIILERAKLMINDILLPFIILILLGTKVRWQGKYFSQIFLYSFPILIYLSVIVIQQFKYRVTEFVPSRYTSPFYPLLLVVGLLIGSWLSAKFLLLKKIPNLSILIIILLFFSTIYYSSIRHIISEFRSSSYQIPNAEYSYYIQSFCNFSQDKQRYLFLQYDSRNWVAQSLYYFCKPITWVRMSDEKITLPKDSLIFSPYRLDKASLKKVKTHHGQNDINLYLVESITELNIKEELAKLSSVLQ